MAVVAMLAGGSTTVVFTLRIPALTSVELTEGFTYAEHERIGEKPRLQFTGAKLRELPLGVTLSRALGDPDAALATMRAAAKAKQVLAFVWGHGAKVGDFVIEELKTRVLATQSDGRLIAATVDLKLKEYAGPTTKPPAPAVRKK